jgi:hypothetical protein
MEGQVQALIGTATSYARGTSSNGYVPQICKLLLDCILSEQTVVTCLWFKCCGYCLIGVLYTNWNLKLTW